MPLTLASAEAVSTNNFARASRSGYGRPRSSYWKRAIKSSFKCGRARRNAPYQRNSPISPNAAGGCRGLLPQILTHVYWLNRVANHNKHPISSTRRLFYYVNKPIRRSQHVEGGGMQSRRDFLRALPVITAGVAWSSAPAIAGEGSGNQRWAMVVDVQKCIGCQACTVSCIMENAVPENSFRTIVSTYEVHDGRQTVRYPDFFGHSSLINFINWRNL